MTTKKTKATKEEPMTTFLLLMRNGDKQKVTVPSKYKLTFGPLCPGSKSENGGGATSLRLYDGTNQKAVFTGVESFRDMSIEIEVEITKTKEETFFREEDGERKQVVVAGSIKEWINPDAPGTRAIPESNMPKMLAASYEAKLAGEGVSNYVPRNTTKR